MRGLLQCVATLSLAVGAAAMLGGRGPEMSQEEQQKQVLMGAKHIKCSVCKGLTKHLFTQLIETNDAAKEPIAQAKFEAMVEDVCEPSEANLEVGGMKLPASLGIGGGPQPPPFALHYTVVKRRKTFTFQPKGPEESQFKEMMAGNKQLAIEQMMNSRDQDGWKNVAIGLACARVVEDFVEEIAEQIYTKESELRAQGKTGEKLKLARKKAADELAEEMCDKKALSQACARVDKIPIEYKTTREKEEAEAAANKESKLEEIQPKGEL